MLFSIVSLYTPRVIRLLCISLLLGSPTLSASDVLSVPYYDHSRPPLVISTESHTGIYTELFTAVLKHAGIDYELHPVPPLRKRAMFEDGEMAVSCCSNPAWRNREQEIAVQLFSLPIYESADHFIFKRAQPFTIQTPSDLKNRVVGTVRGFTYPGSEFFGTDVKVQTEEVLLEMLHLGRVDLAIVNKDVAAYYIKKNGLDLVIGPVHDKHTLHIRVHRSYDFLLPKINDAISHVITSGQRDTIIRRHLD